MRVSLIPQLRLYPLNVVDRIVEFATDEDSRRAKTELADKAFMGRSVFIREVRYSLPGFDRN